MIRRARFFVGYTLVWLADKVLPDGFFATVDHVSLVRWEISRPPEEASRT